MAQLQHTEIIDRPTEDVFSFVSDLENLARWQPAIARVKCTSEPQRELGSTWQVVGRALGRELSFDLEITDYERPNKLAFRAISGPIVMSCDLVFEPEGRSTRVTLDAHAEGLGILRLLGDAVIEQALEQWRDSITSLKRLVEHEH